MSCFALRANIDRAEKQLNIVEQEGSKDSFLGTLLYKAALNAERTRQEMFETKDFPQAQRATSATVTRQAKRQGVPVASRMPTRA